MQFSKLNIQKWSLQDPMFRIEYSKNIYPKRMFQKGIFKIELSNSNLGDWNFKTNWSIFHFQNWKFKNEASNLVVKTELSQFTFQNWIFKNEASELIVNIEISKSNFQTWIVKVEFFWIGSLNIECSKLNFQSRISKNEASKPKF